MQHSIKNLKGKLVAAFVVVRYEDGTQTESVELPLDLLIEEGDVLVIDLVKSKGEPRAAKDAVRQRVREGMAHSGREGFYGKRG